MQNVASSRLTQLLLFTIVLFQLWFAIRPAASVTPVKAASTVVQYKVLQVLGNYVVDPATIEQQLDLAGKDGWTVVACLQDGKCILKK